MSYKRKGRAAILWAGLSQFEREKVRAAVYHCLLYAESCREVKAGLVRDATIADIAEEMVLEGGD